MLKLKIDNKLSFSYSNKRETVRFGLSLHNAKNLPGDKTSLAKLLFAMEENGFPLAKYSEGKPLRPFSKDEIQNIANEKFRSYSIALGSSGLTAGFIGFLWLAEPEPISEINFTIQWFQKEEKNELNINLGLDKQDFDKWDTIASRFLKLGKLLYKITTPSYVCIDDITMNIPSYKDVRDTKLSIYWVNFFGPEYVKKYGKEYLLGAPSYLTKELPDGGVYYQVTEKFTEHFKNPFADKRIKEYFAKAKAKFAKY